LNVRYAVQLPAAGDELLTSATGHLHRRGLSSVIMTRQLRPGSGHEFNSLESMRRTLVLLSN